MPLQYVLNASAPPPNLDVTSYHWWEGGLFSEAQLADVHALAATLPYRDSLAGGVVNTDVRISRVKWIEPTPDRAWLFDRLFYYARLANERQYHFALHSAKSLQYTVYTAENQGKYDWHLDVGKNDISRRKLSAVVLLSDPSEFDGGELQIMTSKDPKTVPLKRGSIVFFPSFLLHRVTPVTRGERRSLVFWVEGPTSLA